MLNFRKYQGNAPEPTQPPFWVDEPNQDLPGWTQFHYASSPFGKIYGLIMTILPLALFVVIIWELLGPIAAIALIALILSGIAYGVILWKRYLTRAEQKKKIRKLAQQTTGADVIGSAVHVAGHPLFERDQPVVLALKGDELSIHTYQSQVPVDVIRLDDIQAIHTVVYDDERVPHIDVIDSTAQALQVKVTTNRKEYTCLFRRLRNVRAIDWYHAVQKAKVS